MSHPRHRTVPSTLPGPANNGDGQLQRLGRLRGDGRPYGRGEHRSQLPGGQQGAAGSRTGALDATMPRRGRAQALTRPAPLRPPQDAFAVYSGDAGSRAFSHQVRGRAGKSKWVPGFEICERPVDPPAANPAPRSPRRPPPRPRCWSSAPSSGRRAAVRHSARVVARGAQQPARAPCCACCDGPPQQFDCATRAAADPDPPRPQPPDPPPPPPAAPPPTPGCIGGLQKQGIVDIDANNAGNPLACAEYAADIFEHLHEVEVRLARSSSGSMLAGGRAAVAGWTAVAAGAPCGANGGGAAAGAPMQQCSSSRSSSRSPPSTAA